MGMVAPSYNASTDKVEARGSEVYDQPQLHIKFKTTLHYMKPYLKKMRKENVYWYVSLSTPHTHCLTCTCILPACIYVRIITV